MAIDYDQFLTVQTEFAVDMTCQSCVGAVQEALQPLAGIERYDIDLANKRVTVTGKTPPSQLLSALKATQRQVIVRGASSLSAPSTFAQSAAVSILESPLPLPVSLSTTNEPSLASLPTSPAPPRQLPGMNEDEFSQKVFGISRFVQIAPKTVLMDLTVRLPPAASVGLSASNGQSSNAAYDVYISTTGNMINPPETTGAAVVKLGSIVPDKEGYGDLFREVQGELWEWVGRGCVVQSQQSATGAKALSPSTTEGAAPGTIFAGVVARSSGAWGNEKTVCACSGRTMWEEGRDMQAKSSL